MSVQIQRRLRFSLENRQWIWFYTANRQLSKLFLLRILDLVCSETKHCFHVFFNLFGRLEILIVNPIVIEFAILGGVLATDWWAGVIDAAAIVRLQMFTGGVNADVPVSVFGKDAGVLVQQKPADVFEFRPRVRNVDGKCKIATALCRAILA